MTMKKLIPNPEYANARFVEKFIFADGVVKGWNGLPEIRTNNPNYLSDGCREEDRIPSHIVADEGTIFNP